MKSIALFLSLLFTLLAISAPEIQGQEKSRAILIYDASGSMWGQIDGKPKIEIAREVAADLIRDRPENLELGFMAYGHRRKGDCSDIELLIAPGAESTESLLSVVNSLIPRGKTPIYDSVLQAAEVLRFTEEASSVILVTDGVETCGGDLKALGQLLKEKGIDFKTHIIGFAMTDAETAPLRELSATTGGLYADAGNADQLRLALEKALLAITEPISTLTLVPVGEEETSVLKNGVSFEVYAREESETAIATGAGGQLTLELEPGTYLATATFAGRSLEAEVMVAEGRDTTHTFTFSAPGLKLEAKLEEDGEPLTEGLAWKILGAANAEGVRPQVTASYNAAPEFRLAPGDYLIVATRGNAKVEKEVSFGEEPQTIAVIFGAGNLQLSAASSEGGEAIKSGLSWQILGDPDAEGNRPWITTSFEDQPTFTLPAGSYLARVRQGSASVSKQVEVVAGKLSTDQFILGSGVLVAKAIMNTGMPPYSTRGLSWRVFSEPDAGGKRKTITNSFDSQPRLTLPAGTFRIEVKRGNATTSTDVEIRPGETTETILNLNAAEFQANAIITDGAEPFSGRGLSWQILSDIDAGGNRKGITNSFDAAPTFVLPVGRYLASVKQGAAIAQIEFDVVAGQLNTATLNLNSGVVVAKAIMTTGMPPYATRGLSWRVFSEPDAEGKRKTITNSFDSELRLTLPAGTFRIEVKRGNATTSTDVEIRPGETTETILNLNAAEFRANAIMTDGAEPFSGRGLSWQILSDLDAGGNRKRITESFDAAPTFVLPVGRYLAIVKQGEATAQIEIDVVAGQPNTATLNLNSGSLALTLVDAEGTKVVGSRRWRILSPEDAEGPRKQIAVSYEDAAQFVLSAGDFHVELKMGHTIKTSDVSITAGKAVQLEVQME